MGILCQDNSILMWAFDMQPCARKALHCAIQLHAWMGMHLPGDRHAISSASALQPCGMGQGLMLP